MAVFYFKDFLNDLEFKLLFYLHRVGKGVSISSTSFQCDFQAITISCSKCSRWTKVKIKSSSHTASSAYLHGILLLKENMIFRMNMTLKRNIRNVISQKEFGYYAVIMTKLVSSSIQYYSQVLISWPDVVVQQFHCLHPLQTQHRMTYIHRSNFFLMSSIENRATKNILLLVSAFVFSHFLASCRLVQLFYMIQAGSW